MPTTFGGEPILLCSKLYFPKNKKEVKQRLVA
ncbi:hypothetical protein [Staphylococcus aureus]